MQTNDPNMGTWYDQYDGDGERVKTIIEGAPNDTATTYLGNYYEVETIGSASTVRSYYYAGSQRLAMRANADLYYLLGDHLGSTSLSYKAVGDVVQTQTYMAWGENRWHTISALPTMLRYTGQRAETSLGIYFYGSRWYDHCFGCSLLFHPCSRLFARRCWNRLGCVCLLAWNERETAASLP
jgi:hypothetical protein